jgi:hypothetical protein
MHKDQRLDAIETGETSTKTSMLREVQTQESYDEEAVGEQQCET